MPRILSVSAKPVDLPLKQLFATAKGRTTISRTLIIEVRLDSGHIGLGESTPIKYVTGETVRSAHSTIVKAARLLCGEELSDWRRLSLTLQRRFPNAPAARAGMETALLDASAKLANKPLYEFLGGSRMTVETDETVSVVSPEQAAEEARAAWTQGIRRIKIKAGGGPEDVARVLAVAEAAPEADLKVDANQAFSPRAAIDFVRELERAGVKPSLIEQPVAKDDIAGLIQVSEAISIPVYADESAVTPADVLRLAEAHAVSGVNVKLMKCGFRCAFEIVQICRQARLGLMLGCMLESKIGQSASLHFACATQAFEHFDLDSDNIIAQQPVTGGFTRTGGKLELGDEPGLGCAISCLPRK
ncbi:MAG: dipeptide epimerase [Armatimonadota bacterium]|nr:dipeptide epimerase [Armatimonadota bacterium]